MGLRWRLLAVVPLLASQCNNSIGGGVPDRVVVRLPDGTTQQVTLGAGVPSLANSTWEFFQTAGAAVQSSSFLTVVFGPQGNLAAFEDNTVSPEIFGGTILFDGERHATNQQGLSYEAGTYGAETNDATGFIFEARLLAFAVGVKVAQATATATGEFASNDPDAMSGTFSVLIQGTSPSIPFEDVEQTLEFVAHRVD